MGLEGLELLVEPFVDVVYPPLEEHPVAGLYRIQVIYKMIFNLIYFDFNRGRGGYYVAPHVSVDRRPTQLVAMGFEAHQQGDILAHFAVTISLISF